MVCDRYFLGADASLGAIFVVKGLAWVRVPIGQRRGMREVALIDIAYKSCWSGPA